MNDTMSVKELGERLGIGRSLAYRLVNSGEIPVMRIGKVIRISRQAYQAYLYRV